MKNLFVVIGLVVMFFTGDLFGQTDTATQSDPNVESFEKVWQTISDSHWDRSKVGQEWQNAHDELLPKVREADSKQAARRIMMELIGTLGQSHFGIIPSDSYDALDVEGGGKANTGITARVVEGDAVVTAVRNGSSAAEAGIKPGWTFVKIRDEVISEFLEKLGESDAAGPQRFETTAGMVFDRMLSDKSGSSISMEMKNNLGETQLLQVPCEIPPGAKIAKLGHLPPIQVRSETRTFENNIGYYHFNAFLDPIRIMPEYRKAVRDKNHSRGLIIDLRGNIGGLAAMTMGMAGEFVSQTEKLGVMTMKDSELNFVAFPKGNPITVPVAVLIDECSISSAEILAGGLQDIKKATIFGSRSAGLALPSQVIKLPNGDGFQFAMADYHSASGKTLEKDGVVPDVVVELTKQNLSTQNDPVLLAAIAWINEKGGD